MAANCTIYYLDMITNPVILTRSTTIWSLSEYFFDVRVADADLNDSPRRKIVRVSGVQSCTNSADNLAILHQIKSTIPKHSSQRCTRRSHHQTYAPKATCSFRNAKVVELARLL